MDNIGQAQEVMTMTDVTVIGVMTLMLFVSWFVVWKLWQTNQELNTEIRKFIEDYNKLSTKILIRLGGKDDV